MYGFIGGGGQPVSGSVYVTGFTLASAPRSEAISFSLVSPTSDFSTRRITSATANVAALSALHPRIAEPREVAYAVHRPGDQIARTSCARAVRSHELAALERILALARKPDRARPSATTSIAPAVTSELATCDGEGSNVHPRRVTPAS